MRSLLMMVAAVVLIGAAPPPTGLEGTWANMRNTIHLRLATCGNATCGTVVWATPQARADARKGSGQELIGSRLLTDLRADGQGKWRGRAYVPDIDRRAAAVLVFTDEGLLRVSGCVLGGLICRSRHWKRIG